MLIIIIIIIIAADGIRSGRGPSAASGLLRAGACWLTRQAGHSRPPPPSYEFLRGNLESRDPWQEEG